MYRFVLLIILTINSFSFIQAQQPPRELASVRINSTIKVDGILDEPVWKQITPATNFVEWRPAFGLVEGHATRTEVFIGYDNTAIYVGGFCYELSKDSISKELVGRDKVGVNDYVGVIFDTYLDKMNGFGFYVTPLGEQYDAKYSTTGGEDGSWSAVWDSEANIHENGWSFEMKIPFSAIRFNSADNQSWGLNITRNRKKIGKQFMWNPMDPKLSGLLNQAGLWTGIEKIQAPVRLSFSPYISGYINHDRRNDKAFTNSINGGMDVKYGLNESFTLDMTLIPDFGQVRTDNQVLNLSPFEVRYNENRAFFTEGTELFNKGNLFYSRRIGSTPIKYWSVQDELGPNETIIKNPQEAKLINATKVSGRTKSGLGIGFFNAMTQTMYAEVEDDAKTRRKIETSPFTNYNIIVLDQSLKNNSSVSLVNTNVLRNGSARDANVTAAIFDINDRNNKYKVDGKFSVSQLSNAEGDHRNGYSHELGFGRTSGALVFKVSQELVDDKYNINDMGIMNNPNYLDHYLWIGTRFLKPTSWYNRMQWNYNFAVSHLYKKFENQAIDEMYQTMNMNINGNIQFKSLWWTGALVSYNAKSNDFYEARSAGRVFTSPEEYRWNAWVETNNTKKYYVSTSYSGTITPFKDGKSTNVSLFQRYRFSDKLSLSLGSSYGYNSNDVGFYDKAGDDILFSLRNRNTVETAIEAKYNFTNKAGFSLITRHYWSKVKNKELYELNNDGSLSDMTAANINHQNYNNFYINLVYTWQFAPGSFLNIVWKDESSIFENSITSNDYFKNFDRTISAPQANNLSLKLIYYLDYLSLKKK